MLRKVSVSPRSVDQGCVGLVDMMAVKYPKGGTLVGGGDDRHNHGTFEPYPPT